MFSKGKRKVESVRTAVGIDFGNTFSCAGCWTRDQVEIISNDQHNRKTYSYVAFTEKCRLIGDVAREKSVTNPSNTVFNIKRLIGRRFWDKEVQQDLTNLPFKIIDLHSKPAIQVEFKDKLIIFTPVEIASMILLKMKQAAEDFLKEKVTDVVITIPDHFNYSQRQAIRDAAYITGLKVPRLINDTTAAAIAFALQNKCIREQIIMIFDIGGGNLSVALMVIDDGYIEVSATAGHSHLGGEDFDDRLLDYFVREFKNKTNKDVSNDARALRRLRTACERAKRTLSSADHAYLEIESLFEDLDFRTSITRDRFEELCMDLFRSALDPVETILGDSKFDKSRVDEIVLVGGSSRIPKIQKLLSEFFNGKKLCKSINPDEAVAFGATIQAAILSDLSSKNIAHILPVEVLSHSLGIESAGGTAGADGVITTIIHRNSTFPTKKTQILSTHYDNQTSFPLKIFEVEQVNAKTSDKNLLGSFELVGIAPAPRGVPKIEVTFDMHVDGILTVSATDMATRHYNTFTVTDDTNRISRSDLERMAADAKKYNLEDELIRHRVQACHDLESSLYSLRDLLNEEETLKILKKKEIEPLESFIESTLNWLENNQEASTKEYLARKKELDSRSKPIIHKYNGPWWNSLFCCNH